MNRRLKDGAHLMSRLWHEEDGQDLIEYALLAALVSLGAIASMRTLAGKVSNVYTAVQTNFAANV